MCAKRKERVPVELSFGALDIPLFLKIVKRHYYWKNPKRKYGQIFRVNDNIICDFSECLFWITNI